MGENHPSRLVMMASSSVDYTPMGGICPENWS